MSSFMDTVLSSFVSPEFLQGSLVDATKCSCIDEMQLVVDNPPENNARATDRRPYTTNFKLHVRFRLELEMRGQLVKLGLKSQDSNKHKRVVRSVRGFIVLGTASSR